MTPTHFLRGVALAIATAAALAGCAGSDADSAEAAETTEEVAETTTTEALESADEADVDEETAADGDAPAEIEIDTYSADPVSVPFDPATIVVLDLAALDTIDFLGLGDRVVGLPLGTALPPHLEAYADVENVGTLFEPDFETINALEPDVIIAGGRSQALVPDLAEIAPTLDYSIEWGSTPFLESMAANSLAIGKLFGVEADVEAALEQIAVDYQDVAGQASDDGLGLVLLTTGGEVSAFGPDPEGRFDLVYNVFGIQPALEQVAIDNHGDSVSFEFLAETNPDIIVVLDRDAAIGAEGESAQAILDNELVNGTAAAQNDKIVYVDTAKWYLSFGGLSSVETMIDEIDSVVD